MVVNKGDGKFASAHDFRRAFGTRWARKVMPMVLQKLMRHDSIETTMRYYVDLDVDDMAEELWKAETRAINTFINNPPLEAKKSRKGARVAVHAELLYLIRLMTAEGKGFEPSTGCPAPDFECFQHAEFPGKPDFPRKTSVFSSLLIACDWLLIGCGFIVSNIYGNSQPVVE